MGREVKDDSLSKQLIRLSYAEIILHHAEVDSTADFVENLQEDLSSPSYTEAPSEADVSASDKTQGVDGVQQDKESRRSRIIAKFKSDKKLLIASMAAIILILPAILFLFWSNLYYKDKILPGTEYASVKLSSNPEEALHQIQDASVNYKFTLEFGGAEKIYTPNEVGLQVDTNSTVNAAKQQSNQVRFFARPFALLGSRQVQSTVILDQEKLKLFLEQQNYSDKLPEDAKIEFDSNSARFVAVPEVAGRGIDSKSLAARLQAAALNLNSQPIDLRIENVTPSITSESLEPSIKEANQLIDQKITITSPNKSYTATAKDKKDWLSFNADPANSTYIISTNEKAQKDYVDSIASKVNRKMEKRLYATIDGTELLLQEGSSGLQVVNLDSVKSQLLSLVKSKMGGIIAIEVREEPPTTENVAASGGRWIFADLSQFRVFAYEGATLVNSFAMSSGTTATPTPTGSYSVMSKVRVKTMTSGGNKNSKDYYSVPNIEWVAYFKSGGYAIHGVYWHNKFGVENTSHGCMGMSNTSAQWVYNFVEVGTPVIVVA